MTKWVENGNIFSFYIGTHLHSKKFEKQKCMVGEK